MLTLCCTGLVAAMNNAAAAGTTVLSDDFEAETTQSPPPGWAMWGAEQYKTPANYTRDTAQAHGGRASLRIYHPAGTAGYLVSAPDRAIKPRSGMMYTVAFWARAEKPGRATFSITAYSSLQPFADAPSPGGFALDVTPQWKEFSFTIHEGWDFFAERSRYLLLTFHATNSQPEEQTLWVDDVLVTEQKSSRAGRLVDETALETAALQQPLRPGDKLEFTVDTQRRLHRANRDVGGVSFHRVVGWTGQPYNKQGEYTLLPQMETAIRDMHLPMTRFYGVGDEPFGLEGALDRVADICRRIGVPQDHTVLELETQSAATKLAPEVWAQAVKYCLKQGYKFRHWEISNEPYSSLWGEVGAFPTAADYIQHFKAVSAAMRQANPKAQIGVSIAPDNQQWGNRVLKEAAGLYDFVVPHYYGHFNAYDHKFEDAVLTENWKTLDRILKVQALINAYNPGKAVYQYDTEWGLHSPGPHGERADNADRDANIWGTLYRAVRLIYYTRDGLLAGASSWQMLSSVDGQGFGILSQQAPDQRFMLYWLYYYFNRHVGDQVLATDGTAPYYATAPKAAGQTAGPLTPTLATLSANGKEVYLIIANAAWDRAIPCHISLRHLRAGHATGVTLSHPDPEGKPLLPRKEDAVSALPVTLAGDQLACTLPPHSVVFITVGQ